METAEINRRLDDIAARAGVRILYAVEAGSRAWGFASPDSDYDVRFVYARRPDSYLSVTEIPDTLEFPIVGDFDAAGWDVRKAMRLFGRSNGPVCEWLGSPIVYREDSVHIASWRGSAETIIDPKALAAHYIGMAKRPWFVDFQEEEVRLKATLYALRAVCAAQWIVDGRGVPPVDFRVLLSGIELKPELTAAVEALLEAKSTASEKAKCQPHPEVYGFVGRRMEALDERVKSMRTRPVSGDALDRLAIAMIKEGEP